MHNHSSQSETFFDCLFAGQISPLLELFEEWKVPFHIRVQDIVDSIFLESQKHFFVHAMQKVHVFPPHQLKGFSSVEIL